MKPSKKTLLKNMLVKVFKYLEPLWTGVDGKISLRAVGAIALIIDFISNVHTAVYKWEPGKSLEGLSLLASIEMGGVAMLLGLTMYQNISSQKIESQAANPAPAPITIEKVETVSTGNTKAEVVNAEKVDVVNTQNTNIAKQSFD